jgi:hypothetical protein
MIIPEEIKLCGITYKVELDEDLADDRNAWGATDYKNQTIRIWSRLAREQMEMTFVHEVLHILAEQSGFDSVFEEPVVVALGNSLYGFIKKLVELTELELIETYTGE